MVAAGVLDLDPLQERDELWSCAGGFGWVESGVLVVDPRIFDK
jgi:hypothetical protein